MEKFPDGLQYEIHLHMHLTVLSDSFLFNCFDDSCLRALAKKMHRHHHLPGHQILHEGDDIDSVHLVRRGKIDIMVHNKQCGTISESYLLKLAIACTVVNLSNIRFLFKVCNVREHGAMWAGRGIGEEGKASCFVTLSDEKDWNQVTFRRLFLIVIGGGGGGGGGVGIHWYFRRPLTSVILCLALRSFQTN